MKKAALVVLALTSAVSCMVGEVRTKDGKEYVVPYSRENDLRINEKGEQYRKVYINERDKSNEIIVYSDLTDRPAKHCASKDGHSILRKDANGNVVRLCRLDTPGARVEGSKIEVDEIEYYIANTENKYVWEKVEYLNRNNPAKKIESQETLAEYAKYTRPEKAAEIRKVYLEPRDEAQEGLRALYDVKYQEQYGNKGL